MDNAKTKIDDNFAKKLETDALTKAISKLGFNADIFMGKFDDQRYLDEVNKEFGNTPQAPQQKTLPALTKDGYDYLMSKGTKEEIQKALTTRQMTNIQKLELEIKLK
jgi:hypothetical protein